MPKPNKAAPRLLPSDVKAALLDAVTRAGAQTRVAADLQVSSPVISQLLSDRYMGDVPSMAERIRGKYMAQTVTCPVMGQLGRNDCITHQSRPLVFTNHLRAALHRACPTCPHRKESTP